MIGVSLSMIVMAAVLSSYVYVARAYTRTIGFGEPNQPTLESQDRRTLAIFAQDAQVAAGVQTTPTATYPVSASEVTLIVPSATGGTKNVTYYYNSTTSAATVTKNSASVTVPAKSLARIDWSTSPASWLTLHTSVQTCVFTYYDTFADIEVTGTARPYTTYVDYLTGIKQISLTLTSRAGTGTNLTQLYKITSPRYTFRNKGLLY
jgi:hypothetical protein